jgi:hypothetical protein
MKYVFNITKEQKHDLIDAITAITGDKAVYQFTPTYAYTIGDLAMNRDATLTAPDEKDMSDLIVSLKDSGFDLVSTEADVPKESADSEDGTTDFIISVPLDAANVEVLANLIKSKETLIEKALGVTDTGFQIKEDHIQFPWFNRKLTDDEMKACTHFISALCQLSREQKRASAKPTQTDNEKYTFRCFLLRLGFIGKEYKAERKVLLQNLTGSSAFRNVPKEEAAPCD